jgi:hypothetical protein
MGWRSYDAYAADFSRFAGVELLHLVVLRSVLLIVPARTPMLEDGNREAGCARSPPPGACALPRRISIACLASLEMDMNRQLCDEDASAR